MSAVVLGSATVQAQAADIVGTWSGGGYAKITDGDKERVRCRITYERQGIKTFSVHAVCASPSVRVLQTGTILRATTNTYLGSLRNMDYNVTAKVRIRVSGSSQTITMQADDVTGRVTLRRQ